MEYRDMQNETTSRILQAIAAAGLHEQVRVLGMLPDVEFGSLIRAAAAVVQPSLFEGWSTVIQDCKALGRPLICSDLPVHREQAPDALEFFECERADRLADAIAAHWGRLQAGPDLEAEDRALSREREFAHFYGKSVLSLCSQAQRDLID